MAARYDDRRAVSLLGWAGLTLSEILKQGGEAKK
jgi:hypothetical protein